MFKAPLNSKSSCRPLGQIIKLIWWSMFLLSAQTIERSRTGHGAWAMGHAQPRSWSTLLPPEPRFCKVASSVSAHLRWSGLSDLACAWRGRTLACHVSLSAQTNKHSRGMQTKTWGGLSDTFKAPLNAQSRFRPPGQMIKLILQFRRPMFLVCAGKKRFTCNNPTWTT